MSLSRVDARSEDSAVLRGQKEVHKGLGPLKCSILRNHNCCWSFLALWVRGSLSLAGRERLAVGTGLSCMPVRSGAAGLEKQSLQILSEAD